MRTTIPVVAVLMAVLPAQASWVEDFQAEHCTEEPLDGLGWRACHYQLDDGGARGDAPDQCGDADRPVPSPNAGTGILVPVDDEEDHFWLELGAAPVNVTLVQPEGTTLASGADVVMEVRPVTNGQCGSTVGETSYARLNHHFFGDGYDTLTVRLEGLAPGLYDVGVKFRDVRDDVALGMGTSATSEPGVALDVGVPLMCQPYCTLSAGSVACTWELVIDEPEESALCYLETLTAFLGQTNFHVQQCRNQPPFNIPRAHECHYLVEALEHWLLQPDQADGEAFNAQPASYSLVATTE